MVRKRDRAHKYDFRSSDTLRDLRRGVGDEHGDPCVRGNQCAARDYEGNPERCPRPFCDKDREWVIRAIRDLPSDYTRLRDDLLPRSQQQEERVSGSKEPPLPLATDVQAFMREIVHVALSWEAHVRTANRLSPIPAERVRDEIALWRASGILAEHVDSLIALPASAVTRYASRKRLEEIGGAEEAAEEAGDDLRHDVRWDAAGDAWEHGTMTGVEAALELLALHGRARGMLGLNRQRRRITEVDCDGCGARATLFQREAAAGGWDPEVRCSNCPMLYAGDRLTLLMARVYEAQVAALDEHGGGTSRPGEVA